MRILGVGAHPDDLEVLCAGTLAKYAEAGHQVVMCHVTIGEKGHFHIPSEQLAKTREQEAKEAAQLIDAESMSLGLLDGEVVDNLETQLLFIEAIRQAEPDVIITHSPNDIYHSDHAVVSKLVLDASFHASVPYVKTETAHHPKVPPIYYMETMAGLDFIPSEYVDISATFITKMKMLSQHKSQLKWLMEHDNLSVIDSMETMAKFRGYQCGARYAEGFNPCLVWPRIIPERLLP
jgi:LmbE family N-acetylglucosaminyl deacetylase